MQGTMHGRYLVASRGEIVEALEESLGLDHRGLLPVAALTQAFAEIEAARVTRIETTGPILRKSGGHRRSTAVGV